MTVAFGSAPENVDKMVAIALKEITRLRDEGPSDADVSKDQEVERRELEVALKRNGYWGGALQLSHLLGWDPTRIAKRGERIERLTKENVKDAFRKSFPLDHYTVVSLFPENGATGMRQQVPPR